MKIAELIELLDARGKKVTPDMKDLAEKHNMTLIETPFSVFKTSGLLYQHGIKPLF